MSDVDLLRKHTPSVCDKCRRSVSLNNDILGLLILDTGNPMYSHASSRHILPLVDKNGVLICPGSPSRAQYLDDQLPDTRPGYTYQPGRESHMRQLYARLQEAVLMLVSEED